MKKLFNHTKRPYDEWEGYDEEAAYDWDATETEEEYYAEDEYYAEEESESEYYAEDGEVVYEEEESEGEYYAEDDEMIYEEEAEGEYYAEDGETIYEEEESEGEYYAEDGETIYEEEEAEGEYYAEDGEIVYEEEEAEGEYYAEEGEIVYEEEEAEDEYYAQEGEHYAEDEYYTENGEYYAEDGYAEGEYFEEEDEAYYGAPLRRSSHGTRKNVFEGMWNVFLEMGVMDRIITTAGIVVLILALVTGTLYVSTKADSKKLAELADVGSQLEGITIIGESGLLAVADAEIARQAAANIVEEENKDYDEEEYGNDVSIKLNMTSVKKDLKIKFTNKETGKLVANVPFSVTITDPDGKSETWSDDDMDGIIYKKNITAGTYSVLVNELVGDKYKGYTIPTAAQSVEVKKDIAYEKIDVSDEVKTEDEIDVSQEDTQINDTEVESTLKDTVTWVESTAVAENYKEVSKSTITDPATIAVSRSVWNVMRATNNGTVTDGDLNPGTENKAFTVAASPASVTVATGGTVTAQITAKGYTEGKTLKYSVVPENANVATATVDAAGVITVTGKSAGTTNVIAIADYTEGKSMPAQVKLAVTVLAKPTITLDKTTATVLRAETTSIVATIANATTDTAVTAVSDKTEIATVAVNGKTVTVTGVAVGDATITVKYTENGEEIQATCTVTVKANPKEDKTNKLKDNTGNQLYVLEGETYREAVYADYYTADKFFVKGDTKYTGWQTIDGHVYFFTAAGEKVTGEQVIQGAKYNFASDGSLVTSSGTMGIDVSKWNGNIDWDAVKNSGVSYVIIRCGYRGSSQGMLIEDPKFATNIKGATAAGLKVGVYFFTQAIDEVEAVEEASYVLDKIKKYKISYPVFLDVESSGGRADKIDKATRTAVCKAFCETIQRNGYTAGIYANKTWLNNKIDASALSAYKIWLAQYASAPTYKGRYDMWQYTSTGKVSGIKGNVDLNLSYLGY